MATKQRVGIIGAGFSGLYAACKLAKAGLEVEVFEKNVMVGGRSQTFSSDGFLFDMGPSWYWMPDLIDNLFKELGVERSDYYQIDRLETSYQVFWKDKTATKIPSEKDQLIQLFESFEAGGGKKLEVFLRDAGIKYQVAKPLLELPGERLGELLQKEVLKNAFKLDVFKSVEKDVARRFSSDKARSILNFPVLFLGAMPNEIPSLYTLMNYADLELGTWYPKNGMHDIAKALEKFALDHGVKFHFKSNVEEILAHNDRVSGIKTSNGVHAFDYVVSGADYHFTEQHLLPKKYRRYDKKYWDKRKLAPSSLIFYLGFNETIEGLEHHNLFFDEDLNAHGKQIYADPSWPDKPLFYACVPSKTDEKVAPQGKENVFLLMPIAPDLEDSQEIRDKYLNIMIKRMEDHLGTSLHDKLIFKRSFCVSDFKSAYNSYKGNAYGLANTLMQTANLKPKVRSKLKNLYFCGQLTVPGPGVPPALISGKIAANLILQNQ